MDRLDLDKLGAEVAYTLDGARRGELEDETFSALKATVVFRGRSTHTGTAKGVMVNAIKTAGDFLAALPRDGLSPETTEGREGFVHPERIAGGASRATLWMIARDHDDAKLEEHVRRDPAAALEAVDRASAVARRLRATGLPIRGLEADLGRRRARLMRRLAHASPSPGSGRRRVLASAG